MRLVPLTLALALTAAPAWADPPPAADTKPRDQAIDRSLVDLMSLGATVYNSGDAAGCFRLFEGGLIALRPQLAHRPDWQSVIDDALAAARSEPQAGEKAFHLRRAMDRMRAEINPRATGDVRQMSAQVADGFRLTDEEQAVFDLANAERRKAGLPPLKVSERLTKAARAHSADMARQGQLSHTLSGRGPADRIAAVGYQGAAWGENVAWGQPSPQAVVTGWMNSPGHRGNILGAFTELGVGVFIDGGGQRYWTQVFATPAGR